MSSWRWFFAWSLAGAALTFSFLAGLSIGIFVLPFAAVLLVWVVRRAPRLPDAFGFVAGVGMVLVLVAFLNRASDGVDAMAWLLAGVSLNGVALVAYTLTWYRPGRRSAG
jgi:uncharacterized membrane protein